MAVEKNRSEKKRNGRPVQNGARNGKNASAPAPVKAKNEKNAARRNEKEAAVRGSEQRALQEDTDREILLGEDSQELSSELSGKKRKKTHKPRVRTIRARTKSRLPVSSVFFMLVCTLLIMFMIINYVQINEYTQEVASLKREMTALESERTDLELELEKKNDLATIEEEARKLGMMGSEDLVKRVVKSQKEDTVEKFETEDEDFGIVATALSAIWQNVKASWNIFSPSE